MKLFFLVYYTILITIITVIFLIEEIQYYLDSRADKKREREREKEFEENYMGIKKEFAEIKKSIMHIQCEFLLTAAGLRKSTMNKLRSQEIDKES